MSPTSNHLLILASGVLHQFFQAILSVRPGVIPTGNQVERRLERKHGLLFFFSIFLSLSLLSSRPRTTIVDQVFVLRPPLNRSRCSLSVHGETTGKSPAWVSGLFRVVLPHKTGLMYLSTSSILNNTCLNIASCEISRLVTFDPSLYVSDVSSTFCLTIIHRLK